MIYEQLYHPYHQTFTSSLTECEALTESPVPSYGKSTLRVSSNYLFVIIEVFPRVKHVQQLYHSKVDQCFTFGCIEVIDCFFRKPYIFRKSPDTFRLDKSWESHKIRVVSPFVDLFPLLDLQDSLPLHNFGLIICDQFGCNITSQKKTS